MDNNKFFNKNFFTRSLTALILAPIILLIIKTGGFIYYTTVIIMAVLMGFEWNDMLNSAKSLKHKLAWKITAILYIAIPCASLIFIINRYQGQRIVTWLILTVWITDIFAYFCGRSIGGPKLLPRISPNKTWSGLFGGVLAASIFGYFAGNYLGSEHPKMLTALTALLALYAQIGDLIESWIKRIFEVKDSGKLIPGHGGILDRVDGIILTAPKVAIILALDHWHVF
jgi:phosphatidate cytidylyltransferase